MPRIRTELTYLNSVGPLPPTDSTIAIPAEGQRPTTYQLPSAQGPVGLMRRLSRVVGFECFVGPVGPQKGPLPCQMYRPRIPENEKTRTRAVPREWSQMNLLTYLFAPSGATRRRRLVLAPVLIAVLVAVLVLVLIIVIPFDASAIEKSHEGLWGQAKLLQEAPVGSGVPYLLRLGAAYCHSIVLGFRRHLVAGRRDRGGVGCIYDLCLSLVVVGAVHLVRQEQERCDLGKEAFVQLLGIRARAR